MTTALDDIIAERDIERIVKLYCRAVDRRDLVLLKSLYHPDATEEHGVYSGPAEGFCDFVIPFLNEMGDSFHLVSNILPVVDGDRATCESYCITYSAGVKQPDGTLADLVIGGRYLDQFVREDGRWMIAHRQVVYDWSTRSESDTVWEDELRRQWMRGVAGPSDPLFRLVMAGAG